jgi:transposase
MNISIVGIDLAKNVFQVCALSVDGTIAWNRKVSRAKLSGVLEELPKSTLIAMEACSSSNFWGRYLLERGFRVAVIPAQHVKPFAKHQKNDSNDALAICEASMRPGIHRVSVKTLDQQDIKTLRTVRRRLVQQRTATGNQIRAIAGEYGVIFPIGLRRSVIPPQGWGDYRILAGRLQRVDLTRVSTIWRPLNMPGKWLRERLIRV